MIKDLVPAIHFYDQDFVDMYDRSWVWINDAWTHGTKENSFSGGYLSYAGQKSFSQIDASMSALFLVYSNLEFSPFSMVDYFYQKQEENGAIRSDYSCEDGSPVLTTENPEGVQLPLFSYVEYNFYHKVGNKRRLKDIVPILEKYYAWLQETFMQPNGLYKVPQSALLTGNLARSAVEYAVDFNAAMAMNALYMSEIGDILNDKELAFRYKRAYFALKTRINDMMWDAERHYYYDLAADGSRITTLKHLGTYWTLLASIPNEEQAEFLISYLQDPGIFGAENPFPLLSIDSPGYSEAVQGYNGAVIPLFTFMVVKGLEKYHQFIFARECAIRHLYFILDTYQPEVDTIDDVWEAYLPQKDGHPSPVNGDPVGFPRRRYMPMVGLVTVALMIENVIGLNISLPRKTVDWTLQDLEAMGIQHLSLKRNLITILSNKNARGWEIRLESEKLYYFTIEILNAHKKKTLPIPSGKCSLLIDKL